MTAERVARPAATGRWGSVILAMALVALSAGTPTAHAATSLGDYADTFTLGTYFGSEGSIPWLLPWLETNDDNSSGSGSIRVESESHCASDPCLTIGRTAGSDGSIHRTANLWTAETATLSFDYKRHDHAGTAGHVLLEVSSTGIGGWALLHDFDLSVTDPGQVAFSADITDWISVFTTIRFTLVGNSNNSHLNVDNLRIELFSADNAAPQLDTIADATIPEETPFAFTASASDPNGTDLLSFALDGNEPAGAAISADGDFTWTPTEAQGPGIYSFDVIVTDDGVPALSDSENVTLTVVETNAPPVLGAIGDKSVAEGSLLTFTATAGDADTAPAALSFSLTGGPPSGASITGGGLFTWTPTESQGPGVYTFAITVSDDGVPDGVRSDSETIRVTVAEVNRAPSLMPIASKSVNEGAPLTFTATATDPDLPTNDLHYSLTGAPAGASISPGGSFSWTPTESQGPGSYTFDVVVTDDGVPARSDSKPVTVTVKEANIAPIIDPIGVKTVNEGSLLQFAATATDTDSPPDSFEFSLSGAPAGASITAGGIFRWTPTEAQGPGTHHFTIVATDDGVPALSRHAAVTVIVSEVNVAPVLAAIPSQTIIEGTTFTFEVSATDADTPNNVLGYSLAGAPAGAAISGSGVISWTPTESQGPGTYSFDVVVTDDGSPPLSDTEQMTIRVLDGNNAPVIDAIGTVSAVEGTLTTFTARATDPDVPANTFSFALSGRVPPGASITPTGVFSWIPSEVQGPGVYTFDVVATDTGSPPRSSSRSVSVVVAEANLPPTLDMLTDYPVEAGLPYQLWMTASDPDLPAQALRYTATGLPSGAELSPYGELTWHPSEDLVGEWHAVRVTVTDSGSPAMSHSGSFTLTLVDANLAPVLAPIADRQLTLGETLSFTATATDEDGPADELTFTLGPGAPAGASIDSVSGAFEWHPVEAQNDAVHFLSVAVSDGGAFPKSDSTTFSVTVGQPNVPPILNRPIDQESMPGEKVVLLVPGADPDGYPQTLVYSASNLPPGLTIDPITGAITGKAGFDGLEGSPYSVEVSVSDGRSSASVSFSWVVTGPSDPPGTTPTKTAVVAGIVDITSPPAPTEAGGSEVVRSFVIMSRALRTGADEMSLPILFLALVVGGLIAFGRIGIVPVLRRGTKHKGVIRRYDPLAGTGLVRRATDGAEVFVHSSAIARRDRRVLVAGDSVTFRTVDGAYRDLVTKLRRKG